MVFLDIGVCMLIINCRYASMPFDNVKTRLQSASSNYASMFECMVQTLKHEGIGAFWRGTTPRLVRLTVSEIETLDGVKLIIFQLSSGITFTVYEQVVQLMKTTKPERQQIMLA